MLGTSAIALSLVMLGGVGAEAAVQSPSTLDFKDQSFSFTNDGEGAVSFDAVKMKGKGSSAKLSWNEKTRWDSYDVSGTDRKVDLSSRKTTKDLLVAIRDMTSPRSVVFWIPADTSKYKGKYENGSVVITDAGRAVEGDDLYANQTARFEYRTENGYWKDYNPEGTKFEIYEQQGTTLYFRRKAVNVQAEGYERATDLLAAEEQVHVNVVLKAKKSYFAGKEFKIKIPRKSNAPSISVDYNWQTLKVKDTMEYRTKNRSGSWVNGDKSGEWTSVPSGVKELKMEDLFPYEGVAYTSLVEIRTKADPAKKKPASKVWSMCFPEALPLLSTKFGLENRNGIQGMGYFPEEGLIFKMLRRGGKNYCRFINSDPEDTYEIYDDDIYENKKAKKIAVLKPKTSGKNTEVEVPEKKVPENSTLWVVISGDKKKNRFRSDATPCGGPGTILYPTSDTE